jgi:predicted CXXCH cytochrome family protein
MITMVSKIQQYFFLFVFTGLLLPLVLQAAPKPVATEQVAYNALERPVGVAFAPQGGIMALDAHGQLWRLQASKKILVQAAKTFKNSLDITAMEDGFLVTDTGRRRLTTLDMQGRIQRHYDLPKLTCDEKQNEKENESAGHCQIDPEPVAALQVGDHIYWSDRSSRLCWIEADQGEWKGCTGQRGGSAGQFQYPYQIVADTQRFLYVVDALNARIQIFNDLGRPFSQVGRFGLQAGELFRPSGLAMDAGRELLFISDAYLGTIQVFHRGEPLGALADSNGEVIRLENPTSLAYQDDTLVVSETGANRVFEIRLAFTEAMQLQRVARSESSGRECLMCHLEWAKEAPEPLRAFDAAVQLPVASEKMCDSCHLGPVIDSRWAIGQGSQHPTVYDPPKRFPQPRPYKEDKLPVDFPTIKDHRLSCVSCHTPHDDADAPATLYPGHRNAWLRVANDDAKLCERCHESKASNTRNQSPETRGVNHPLSIRLEAAPFRNASGFPKDEELTHGLPQRLTDAGAMLGPEGIVCQSCHQIHGGIGEKTMLVVQEKFLCTACHQRQSSRSPKQARQKGVHPVNFKPERRIEFDGQPLDWLSCTTCHPVHNGWLDTAILHQPVEKLCESCHERQHADTKEAAQEKGVHPVNFELDDPATLEGEEIRQVTCLTCHAVHRGKPDTPALRLEHRDGQLCASCHKKNLPVVGSDHDLRITAKDSHNHLKEIPKEAGVCGSCHSLHRNEDKQPFLFAVQAIGQPDQPVAGQEQNTLWRNRLCLTCHQDAQSAPAKEKAVGYFNHPAQDIILQSDKKHLPLLDTKEAVTDFGQIACITCHDPHVWRPEHREQQIPPLAGNRDNLQGDPHTSFLRETKPEKTFCLSCHGLMTRTKFKYYHDEMARDVVDYLN